MLEFKYIVKFSETVARLAKRRIMPKEKELKEKRRQALKIKDHDKYREIVEELVKVGNTL